MPHPLYDFCCSMCRLIVRHFMINSKMNISITEHDTVKTLHQLTHTQMYILMISISHTMKNTQNWQKPLIIDLAFHQNFAIFAMCSKH